jgi:hypothetical protein
MPPIGRLLLILLSIGAGCLAFVDSALLWSTSADDTTSFSIVNLYGFITASQHYILFAVAISFAWYAEIKRTVTASLSSIVVQVALVFTYFATEYPAYTRELLPDKKNEFYCDATNNDDADTLCNLYRGVPAIGLIFLVSYAVFLVLSLLLYFKTACGPGSSDSGGCGRFIANLLLFIAVGGTLFGVVVYGAGVGRATALKANNGANGLASLSFESSFEARMYRNLHAIAMIVAAIHAFAPSSDYGFAPLKPKVRVAASILMSMSFVAYVWPQAVLAARWIDDEDLNPSGFCLDPVKDANPDGDDWCDASRAMVAGMFIMAIGAAAIFVLSLLKYIGGDLSEAADGEEVITTSAFAGSAQFSVFGTFFIIASCALWGCMAFLSYLVAGSDSTKVADFDSILNLTGSAAQLLLVSCLVTVYIMQSHTPSKGMVVAGGVLATMLFQLITFFIFENIYDYFHDGDIAGSSTTNYRYCNDDSASQDDKWCGYSNVAGILLIAYWAIAGLFMALLGMAAFQSATAAVRKDAADSTESLRTIGRLFLTVAVLAGFAVSIPFISYGGNESKDRIVYWAFYVRVYFSMLIVSTTITAFAFSSLKEYSRNRAAPYALFFMGLSFLQSFQAIPQATYLTDHTLFPGSTPAGICEGNDDDYCTSNGIQNVGLYAMGAFTCVAVIVLGFMSMKAFNSTDTEGAAGPTTTQSTEDLAPNTTA